MASTFIEIGHISRDFHYGPLASFWWHEKIDYTNNTKRLIPIRIKLNVQTYFNTAKINCFVDINDDNQPKFICSINQFMISAKDMTTAVNTTYQQYLSSIGHVSRIKLPGPNFFGMANLDEINKTMTDIKFCPVIISKDNFKMFVISAPSNNAIDPADGYHISFTGKYKHETALFSQLYENNEFHINIFSIQTGQLLQQFQSENSDDVWKLTGLFRKYSGNELFLLNHPEIKSLFEQDSIKITSKKSDWNEHIFEELHFCYMLHISKKELTISLLKYLKLRKSSLFELYNLLRKFNIIEDVNLNFDQTVVRKLRAWRQLLAASGCKKLKNNNDKEVC
jgi:hypothetical protein